MNRTQSIKVTLLISTYNWKEALSLCLKAVTMQTRMPDEIVIADDGSGNDTREVIDHFRQRCQVPVIHCWQEDKGFRKTRILNYAISQSTGDYIIQIDGDIIIDHHFIADHLNQMRPHTFLRGSRAGLPEGFTRQVLADGQIDFTVFSRHLHNRFNAVRSRILAFFLCRRSNDVRHVKGCNTSFWREDFVAVNGYNNDLSGWGHEDIELAARLYNNGTQLRIVKSLAIGYHLYHKFYSRDKEAGNLASYEEVIKQKIRYCNNGYKEAVQEVEKDGKVWR